MQNIYTLSFFVICSFASDVTAASPTATSPNPQQAMSIYKQEVMPAFDELCINCHGPEKQKADFRIDQLNPDLINGADGEYWEEVLNQLNTGEMPPKKESQPSASQRKLMTDWIHHQIEAATEARRSTGGRNVLRRLTRYEYDNTMRDLLGMDLDYSDKLPPEGAAKEGFVNNSLVLGTSSLHMEYFQKIAKMGLDKALVFGDQPEAFRLKVEGEKLHAKKKDTRKSKKGDSEDEADVVEQLDAPRSKGIVLSAVRVASNTAKPKRGASPTSLTLNFRGAQQTGPILIRVKASAIKASSGIAPRMLIQLGYDGGAKARPTADVASFEVDAPIGSPQTYEFHVRAERFPLSPPLDKEQFLAIHNPFDPGTSRIPSSEQPKLLIQSVEIISPYYATWPPKTRTDILFESKSRHDKHAYALEVLERFMTRAYRRPLRDGELARMHRLFINLQQHNDTFEETMAGTLSAVLSAPGFLLLAEPATNTSQAESVRKLNDYELASRLSYFLWSTMPDNTLFELAAQKKLHRPAVLKKQVARMLDDPRSEQFIENFTSQWLNLDSIYNVAINPEYFPKFKDTIKDAMNRETTAFFGEILRGNLSCMTLIDSDFTMLNASLATYYNIPGVAGEHYRKVALKPEQHRGGILTHGSILTANSTGDDTHPIKRGVWLLERLLGDPPPPPPPAVPTLAESDTQGERLSLKQKLIAHREEEACMNCHTKIDPWGLAFENYSGIGQWRDTKSAPDSKPDVEIKPDASVAAEAKAQAGRIQNMVAIGAKNMAKIDLGAAPLKAPTVQVSDSAEVKRLAGAVNDALTSLQRPYNHLRKLGAEGDQTQIKRFHGYIIDRQKIVDLAMHQLCEELGSGQESAIRQFAYGNLHVLASNKAILERAQRFAPIQSIPKKTEAKPKRAPKRAIVQGAVDPSTTLEDGTKIQNLQDLKRYLLEYKRDAFAENLVRKTLSYALGRYLEFPDTPTVKTIADDFEHHDYRMQNLIESVVLSEPFRTK